MNTLLLSFSLLTLACFSVNDTASQSRFDNWSTDQNPLSVEGKERIDAFLKDSGSSSALILYEGQIAYQYGDIHRKHLIHSIRKAILGILYGQLIQDGRIALDERVGDLALAEAETPFSDLEASASVKQLLESRSGIYLPAAAESAAMKESRPARGSHEPGEAHYYNNWSFNALGTLFEERSSKTIYEAFQDQMAEPLGMTSFKGKIGNLVLRENAEELDILPSSLSDVDGFYFHEPQKSRHKAYHFRLSAHDLALFGQLLLQDGMWEGRQLISKDWIDQATTCRSVVNEDIGGGMSLCYGMMWSVAVRDGNVISFSHTGYGSHLISVHPGADMVIVHRAPTENPDFQRKNHPSQLIGLTFQAFYSGD